MINLLLLSVVSLFGFLPEENVKITGYCPGPPCVIARWADGITAAGTKVHHGVCAADWSVYPLGSVFEIPGYGLCRVEDTGNGVKGKHIDLFFPTANEARHWGVKELTIFYVGCEKVE